MLKDTAIKIKFLRDYISKKRTEYGNLQTFNIIVEFYKLYRRVILATIEEPPHKSIESTSEHTVKKTIKSYQQKLTAYFAQLDLHSILPWHYETLLKHGEAERV